MWFVSKHNRFSRAKVKIYLNTFAENFPFHLIYNILSKTIAVKLFIKYKSREQNDCKESTTALCVDGREEKKQCEQNVLQTNWTTTAKANCLKLVQFTIFTLCLFFYCLLKKFVSICVQICRMKMANEKRVAKDKQINGTYECEKSEKIRERKKTERNNKRNT